VLAEDQVGRAWRHRRRPPADHHDRVSGRSNGRRGGLHDPLDGNQEPVPSDSGLALAAITP